MMDADDILLGRTGSDDPVGAAQVDGAPTYAELSEALIAANECMNHLGDALNGMDANTDEDLEYRTPRFLRVQEVVKRLQATSRAETQP
jgi:hypothetical protein